MAVKKEEPAQPIPGVDPTDRFEIEKPEQLEEEIKKARSRGDTRDIKIVTTGSGSTFVVHY